MFQPRPTHTPTINLRFFCWKCMTSSLSPFIEPLPYWAGKTEERGGGDRGSEEGSAERRGERECSLLCFPSFLSHFLPAELARSFWQNLFSMEQ